MLRRYHITLGATTTAGGSVTSASSKFSLNGARIALEDDTVSCPACRSAGVIKPDGPRVSERWNGRQVALNDDLCICQCSPPPRLVNNQVFKFQTINAERQEPMARATAAGQPEPAIELTTDAPPDAVSILLLHPETREPFKHRPYRLHLIGKVIEGTTDGNGGTRPLSASDRASLTTWHVDGVTGTREA